MIGISDERVPSIGENIREKRKAAGLTQKELAAALGKSLSTIQKYELDLIIPPIEMVRELASVLNTTEFGILGWYATFQLKKEPEHMTKEERELIKKYRGCDNEIAKEIVSKILDMYFDEETFEHNSYEFVDVDKDSM